MEYKIFTGMWACDLQNSKELSSEEKVEYLDIIKRKSDELKNTLNVSIICSQFRGDGLFWVFDAKNMHKTIIDYSDHFCDEINTEKERGKLSPKFHIRTYIDCGNITIIESENEEVKAIGKEVDAFLGLVDNKDSNRIQVNSQGSAVLIATSKFYDTLEDEDQVELNKRWQVIAFDNAEYYVEQYQPRNLSLSIHATNNSDAETFMNRFIELLSKNNIEIVNQYPSNNMLTVVSNKDVRKKVYDLVKNALRNYKPVSPRRPGCIVFAIDLQQNPDPVFADKIYNQIKDEPSIQNSTLPFAKLLVISDVALDEYEDTESRSEIIKDSSKYSFSETQRIYVINIAAKKINPTKPIVYFSGLSEDCVYLHSFDYGGIQLILKTSESIFTDDAEKDFLKLHLRQQLEIGLMLHEGVIIHSAELLRSEVVFETISEYAPLVENGSIKLLFSSKVNDIQRDFKNYIENKIKEYGFSRYGELEVQSLQYSDEDKMDAVISLLCKCPKLVKRDGDGTSELEKLIMEDLSNSSNVLYKNKKEYQSIELLNGGYNLGQLLNAHYVHRDTIQSIISDDIQQRIIRIIERLVNGVVSASILCSVFEQEIPSEQKEEFSGWYFALLHRANYLYAIINTEKFQYMEYLPNQWRNSLFNFSHFCRVFPFALDVGNYIGCERLMKIRETREEWEEFKAAYNNAQILKQGIISTNFDANTVYNERIRLAQDLLRNILFSE